MSDPLAVFAVLCLAVALSEVLVRRTFARHFGTALLVIVVTAVLANLGAVPTGATPVPLYEGIFGVVAPGSIFLLLLGVGLADVRRAGLSMLVLFGMGCVGTVAGVVAGLAAVDAEAVLGERMPVLGGMFVGTYTGGSVNFNAIALEYEVTRDGVLYAGAVAVDSIMTSIWMVTTIALPRLLGRLLPRTPRARGGGEAAGDPGEGGVRAAPDDGVEEDTEAIHPLDLALVLALTAAALIVSRQVSHWCAELGLAVPSILVVTTLALVLAQVPRVRRLPGTRLLGMFGVYLFLAVIGAYCDLGALGQLGDLGPVLLVFVTVVVLVHGLVVFGFAEVLKLDRDMAAVASQANIGGGTSALALARSLGRSDLVLPAVLVGSLGSALGTYLGFLTVGLLG